ncbi:hypothetical protein [Actinopolymorpha alba]|uniref:hypothetical protein n=1 Tax=Actinopolymorpha alba TaxID=533267 RepID=UPI000361D97E|nr:hypothetical protein [Actinopolymorpha alba]
MTQKYTLGGGTRLDLGSEQLSALVSHIPTQRRQDEEQADPPTQVRADVPESDQRNDNGSETDQQNSSGSETGQQNGSGSETDQRNGADADQRDTTGADRPGEVSGGVRVALTKPGRGRPSLGGQGRSPQVTFRAPPALRAKAAERAARDGKTVSQLAREAFEMYLTS